jgi:nucleotide-binding universal stress UspA family protein
MPPEAFAKDARRELDDVLAALGPEGPAVRVERVVSEGNPARVLINQSKDADLLVVGNRGHGGIVGALIGSVSTSCVHHAHCAVVVIRGDE